MTRIIKSKKMSRVLATLLVFVMMTALFCSSASAATYTSKSGTLNGYATKLTFQYATYSYGASGTLTYKTTPSSMYISITYSYRISSTASARTITRSNSNTNNTLLALSVSPDQVASANISASCVGTITAKNGAVWNSGTVRLS